MQVASDSSVEGDFDSAQPALNATFVKRGDQYIVNTEGADGKSHDFTISYTFGVYPLQQYLVAFPDGRTQVLPYAWDSRPAPEGGQRWFSMTPGTRIAHTDELHWTGKQMNWNYMCADCHSTGVRKNYDAATDRFNTKWSEINVGCESCHGAASNHITWTRYPKLLRGILWRDAGFGFRLDERSGVHWGINRTTGNAQRSVARKSDREIEACASCHSRRVQIADQHTPSKPLMDAYVPSLLVKGLYHPDGQQLDEVYNYGSFLQSRMYHAGVTCSDCHEPHTQKLRAAGNALCANCHLAAKYDTQSHTMHAPQSSGSACVSCHMPAATYMQVDSRRDHSIRIPRPDLAATVGVPNACNGCHSDKSGDWAAAQIRSHYETLNLGFQRFAGAFAADDRNDVNAAAALDQVVRDTTESAIARASALARLARYPGAISFGAARDCASNVSPLVRRAALVVLDVFDPEQRIEIARPLLRDSIRAVRIEAARILAPVSRSFRDKVSREAFDNAAAEYVISQRYLSDRPENRVNLGVFFAEVGRLDEATGEFKAAIHLAPQYAPAYVNLSNVFESEQRSADAIQALTDGLAARPSDATLHHAYGLALVRAGKVDDGMKELEKAATLAPDEVRFAYVYAIALHSRQRDQDALRVLSEALKRKATDHEVLFALATINRDIGDSTSALKYARLLLAAYPGDDAAQQLVRSLEK